MGSRTTEHSPFCVVGRCRSQEEENGGMRIEEVFLSYALGVSERSVRSEGMRGGEGYTESAKNLERGVRIHPHPDSTFHIPEGKNPWRYQVSKSS